MRFHHGDCYVLHPSNAFQQYKGVPLDCSRVHKFLMCLEGPADRVDCSIFCYAYVGALRNHVSDCIISAPGLFRRLPANTERADSQVLAAVESLLQSDGSERVFLELCQNACVCNKGDSLLKMQQHQEDDECHPGEASVRNWHIHSARTVMQLKKSIIRELAEEKLITCMIEWCDSPMVREFGCCYDDCCVVYPDGGKARQALVHMSARDG